MILEPIWVIQHVKILFIENYVLELGLEFAAYSMKRVVATWTWSDSEDDLNFSTHWYMGTTHFITFVGLENGFTSEYMVELEHKLLNNSRLRYFYILFFQKILAIDVPDRFTVFRSRAMMFIIFEPSNLDIIDTSLRCGH